MRTRNEFLRVEQLVSAGRTDQEIARVTGIPRRTVSDWRRGERQLRNRSVVVGCPSGHDFSTLDFDAYAYLLGLYLGDGYISAGRRDVWRLRITLDSAYPAIIDACAMALETIFPAKTAHRGQRRESRCVDVSMWSKHWPCFFPQHGPGRKHLRPIRLVPWQMSIVDVHHEAFIRGLIHSDGTRIIATGAKGLLRATSAALCLQQQVRGHKGSLLQKLRCAGHPLDPTVGSADSDLPEGIRRTPRRIRWAEALEEIRA